MIFNFVCSSTFKFLYAYGGIHFMYFLTTNLQCNSQTAIRYTATTFRELAAIVCCDTKVFIIVHKYIEPTSSCASVVIVHNFLHTKNYEVSTYIQGFKNQSTATKTASANTDTNTFIHSYYVKEQIVVNSHRDNHILRRNTGTDRNHENL